MQSLHLLLLLATLSSLVIAAHTSCLENEKSPLNQAACHGQSFGTLMPYPNNCSRFLVCNCEYPTVKECAGGTWFNDALKVCDWPQNTKCISVADPQTPSTTPAPAECTSVPPGVSSLICQRYPEGTLLPYAHNCNAYVNCTQGCPEQNYCPPNKQFNPSLNICDTPSAVNCVDEPLYSTPNDLPTRPTEMTTPTVDPITPTTAPPLENVDACQNFPSHVLLPVADDCTAYTECLEGKAYLRHCPADRVFNPDLRICDYAQDVQCFEGITTTPNAPTPTPTPTPVPTSPPTTADPAIALCRGRPRGITYPYQPDCSFYYYCSGDDNVQLLSCPNYNFYNPYTGNCGPDVPANACRDALTTEMLPTTTLTPEQMCANQPIGTTFPVENNPSQYIMCMGSTARVFNCPYLNYYNPVTGNCGPSVAPDTTTTAIAIESTTPWPTYTLGVCGSYSDGELVAYPNSCVKYISCQYPAPVAYTCGDNLYFDEEKQTCVPASESNCTTAVETTPDSTMSTPTPTPTPIPTTEKPEENVCAGHAVNAIIPYPNSCDKFIICEEPIPVAYECDAGLEFSEELKICTTPESANCSVTTPTDTPITETPITDTPITDAPITDAPITETPITETPITDTPITDTPITNTPITETPITETPVTDTPITETPITETPITDTPITETPITDTPITDTPITNTPITETPVTETPITDTPITDTPITDTPITETPTTDTPITDTPITETPITETPITDTPITDTPITETPVTDTPITHTPITDTPITETPVTETPITETPITETPITDTPITGTPITDAPITETPITNTPITDTPITDTPITETPITDTPITDTPITNTPITETPITETPVTETPITETPITDTPITNTPITDTPITDTPITETPITETPITETPITDTPTTETPTTVGCDTSPPTTDISTTDIPTTIPVTPTPVAPPTSTNNPNNDQNICCGISFGTRLPFPGSCNSYIICEYPVPIVVACPPGTIYDVNKSECGYASVTKCSQVTQDELYVD